MAKAPEYGQQINVAYNQDYGNGIDVGGCRPIFVATVVVVAMALLVGILLLGYMDSMSGSRELARAAELQAQAHLEAQRQANWESRFVYATSFWVAATHDPVSWAILIVVLAVVAGLAYLWIQGRDVGL